ESAAAAALSDSIDAVSAEISRSSVVVPAFAGDATSHVQGFIDLVPENGVLVLEKGAEYRIDGTLVLPHGMTIELNGGTLVKASGATSLLMYNSHPAGVTGYGAGGSGFTLRNGTIRGDSASQTSGITQFHHVDDIRVENVTWDESI